MSHSILITGASGYLGGTLLARLRPNDLPQHKDIYALVRTDAQAEAVKQYGVKPLNFNISDQDAVTKAIVEANITIIFFLIDAGNHEHQVRMIKALAEVKNKTGLDVHFLHTSGAKIFSEHAGHAADKPLLDNDPDLYELQRGVKAPHVWMQKAVFANNTVISTAEAHGVKSYIFIPCIVYGEGEGFGNRISIQTVAIVRAAKNLRRVYDVNQENATWPVCHVLDNTSLYIEILQKILSGGDLGYGKNGYYLASPGNVAWADLYSAMAKGLATRQIVDDDAVKPADDAILEKMAKVFGGSKELVPVFIGGRCALRAVHGGEIGWTPKYKPEHILETADAEVDLILRHLKD